MPVAVSWALLRAVERWLPTHLFVYLFVAAFFGAAAALLATGLAASALLGAAGVYSFDYLRTEYIPWFLLMGWAEAFTTGAAITLMVVYRPAMGRDLRRRTLLRTGVIRVVGSVRAACSTSRSSGSVMGRRVCSE